MKVLLIAALFSLVVVVAVLVSNGIAMYRDPGFHPWPGVPRCPLCDKRIFVWQRYERRPFRVEVDNPQRRMVSISSSGLVHKSCQGTPVTSVKVSVSQ